MITVWDDLVWPLPPTYGTGGGPEWRTEIEPVASGAEAVNQLWDRPRRRWRVSVGRKLIPELEALDAFFEIVAGRAIGFRFEDPLLNRTCALLGEPAPGDQALGAMDGDTAFALRHGRSLGARSFTRRVFRPVSGTVRLALDGVEVDPGDYTLDHATGRGAFLSPVTGALSWGGRFHFAARLDLDRLQASLEGYRNGTAAGADLIEIREFDPS